jgi:hypothetical protein
MWLANVGDDMTHDVEALGVIQQAIAAEVVPAGAVRVRVLPISDEELALAIMNALDEQGLAIVRVDG